MTASATESTGFDLDRPVALHPLTYLVEGDEVTVGCQATDSYGVLPADGAALVRRLAAGLSPNEAARWYADTYGEQVDVVEFLDALTELEFIDGASGSASAAPPLRWQRLARVMFGPIGWLAYASLIVAAIAVMITTPAVRPSYHNIFFSPYVTVVGLVLLLGQIPGLLIHEGFHALAGRRLGLRSSLGVGRRLYFVVFETNLDGLVSVPRRQRYLPILAGILADLVVLAALTVLAAATLRADGTVSAAGGVALALGFTTLLRVVWQFYFYLQTDLYFLVVTVLGCGDLQSTAKKILRNKVWRLLRRPDRVTDESTLPPRDRAVARWYAWLLPAGYAFSIGTLLLVMVPTAWQVFSRIFGRFGGGESWDTLADSLVFLALNIAQLLVLAALAIRDRRRRRAAARLTHVLT
ncbi:hypothetical protein F4553_001751 [Allocatelliglobosispora scoriae]|uniref:PqqD family protein n=1 Tax=Allocatelliglobosispora scoriae TaxID=643052 RepID=A0A841BNQ8_9ACTN|nr:hypothetical protein [Allocatelliglobosispora scoriae]MBB5868372.1 hypothetical protein [Allocatelliglobosispora scoriae]